MMTEHLQLLLLATEKIALWVWRLMQGLSTTRVQQNTATHTSKKHRFLLSRCHRDLNTLINKRLNA